MLERENFSRILLVIATLITLSSLGLFMVEPELSFVDSIWWSIVTLTTVGYGDITPVTPIGRLIAILDMLLGIGVLATMSATIASVLVDQKIREDLGMNSYSFANHIILCEWNHRAKVILNELRYSEKTKDKPIILIANIDRKPIDDELLFFIQGEVSDETLNRGNLSEAETVIILGNDQLDYGSRDAKVILSTLTVESLNPNVYTIVELVDEAFVPTCRRAHADEIIVGSQLSSYLISKAALYHGMSNVISDLLTYQWGNQLYRIAIPESLVGKSFLEVIYSVKETCQAIEIAIQNGHEGEVISNPPSDYELTKTDFLIMIAPPKDREVGSKKLNL
ncbi:MAG: potassium channel family protein [Chroococcales cyanobacterium]